MPMPKSVTKYSKKNGVTFVSNVDRVQYTIQELVRAALKDVAKVIRARMLEKLKMLPGMKKSRRLYRSTQYWVRKRETDLVIGFKHDSWYGALQELGSENQPRRNILRDTVQESISDIVAIQAKYLSAIDDEIEAMRLIDEEEAKGDATDI